MLTGRRNFIKRSLLLTVVCFGSSAKTRAESRFYHLNRFSVAGFQYYAGMQLISLLHPTAGLNLIAEPENQHDEYAVRIEWRGQKLGYVPRSDNRHLNRLLRQGAKLQAQVQESNPQADPWQMLKVRVGMEV